MLIYNTTIKIDNSIINEWLLWQKEIYIPRMLDTKLFYDHRLCELLEQDESEGKTFVIQYFADNYNDYDKYIQYHSTGFYNMAIEKWGNQFIEFGTIMQIVQ